MINKKKIIIFSDFDGTITEHDVILTIMEKFAPPGWIELKDKILYERTITLKDGVEKLFGLIESRKKNEIIDYIKEKVKLREGFIEFTDFCKKEKIEFNVLSGGLDFHIEPILENFRDKLKIFSNKANFNSKNIKIDYEYLPENCILCGDCGFCKIEVIEKYPKEKFIRILIGDSLTDLAASKVVDIVFARGDLIKYLEKERSEIRDQNSEEKSQIISYIPFNNFHEVKEQLVQKLQIMI